MKGTASPVAIPSKAEYMSIVQVMTNRLCVLVERTVATKGVLFNRLADENDNIDMAASGIGFYAAAGWEYAVNGIWCDAEDGTYRWGPFEAQDRLWMLLDINRTHSWYAEAVPNYQESLMYPFKVDAVEAINQIVFTIAARSWIDEGTLPNAADSLAFSWAADRQKEETSIFDRLGQLAQISPRSVRNAAAGANRELTTERVGGSADIDPAEALRWLKTKPAFKPTRLVDQSDWIEQVNNGGFAFDLPRHDTDSFWAERPTSTATAKGK